MTQDDVEFTFQKLIVDEDIEIYVWKKGGVYTVQINTSSETESWETLSVFLNDAKASRWE